VIPKPYTEPHPPLWQPFSVSEKTIRWCAQEGIMPWILISHPPAFRQLCEAYLEEANKAGRKLALGDSIGAHRSVHLGKTRDEAYALGETAAGIGWPDYFAPFGFFEAFRFPGETTPVPQTYDRMIEAKFEMIGTVDDIKRELEAMVKNTNLEWFGWYFDQGVMSWDDQRRQMELFSKVMKEFNDLDGSPKRGSKSAAEQKAAPERV
jgi:alkanesulfonate monooxygenase SsuD/methylene tetrahydromethanopterin reductase-like flavin-dependent oxidoreductase (luciferase family)